MTTIGGVLAIAFDNNPDHINIPPITSMVDFSTIYIFISIPFSFRLLSLPA